MQTDGWPEMDEGKMPKTMNEQDLLQAKTVIINWIKDLRAQPEVRDIHISYLDYSFKYTYIYSKDTFHSHRSSCSKVCGLGNLWQRFWRTCRQPGAGAACPIC